MARMVLLSIWRGLVLTGSARRTIPPSDIPEARMFKRRRLGRPPASHPERLVPDAAVTSAEAVLRRRLDLHRRTS
ncbi:DUF6059 family protein [Kitasatospora sp. NPDC018058]|uniref:DUF6059 family protein n=1 Tax=Kitasatospora sp. NPDC018058 TaxID=3364025 RepID=UPI0037C11189